MHFLNECFPDATKCALNFFRALFRYQSDFSCAEVLSPVLLLWGCNDHKFGEDLAEASQKYCGDIRLKKIAGGSHWINQDMPDVVNKHMELFFNEPPPPDPTPEY